ncbi:MAG: hypothetical protein U9R25_01345 [Chloroflexota bacterium]|nr:hypothetical protein [Chloroflexota bacterium]
MTPADPTTPEPSPEQAAQARPPVGLSFGDGFQFGCGFFVAGLIAGLLALLVLLLTLLILSLTGFNLFGDLLGSTTSFFPLV